MSQVKVALIGYGNFGQFRLKQLMQMDDVTVSALVSSNPDKLRAVKEQIPSIHGYTSSDELFEREQDLDAIVVCLPPACHGTIELEAAKRVIGIFVEKPVGLDLSKAEEIEREIRKHQVISCVGYQGRYNPCLRKLQELLQNQKAGIVIGRFLCGTPGVSWWSDPALSGGQLVEQVTHVFDMMRYLFGEVRQVYGVRGTKEGVSCSSVVMSFLSGESATVVSGSYLDPQTVMADVGLTIFTDQCQVEYDWNRYLRFSDLAGSQTWNFTSDQHYICLRTFIEAVKNKNPHAIRSDYSDGLKSLRLTLAAQQSIYLQRSIDLMDFGADKG